MRDASLFATDHVPVYAPPYVEVNGTAMLLSMRGDGVRLFDTFEGSSGRVIQTFSLSDTQSPRLHPSGRLYYRVNSTLVWTPQARHDPHVVRTFPSPITVGGNEGDFDESFKYLPIVRGENVGILNVETNDYVETHAGVGIDWAQVGFGGDVIAVGFKSPERIISFRRASRSLLRDRQLAPALGHEDTGHIGPRPVLVTTTSNWRSGWPRGGGSEEWLVAIDMFSGEVIPIRQTHWTAYHIACWGDWVCVSFYVGSSDIWMGKIDGSESHVIAVAKGAASIPYTAQPHAAFSSDGRYVYFGDEGKTFRVDVSDLTRNSVPDEPDEPVDPPPPSPPKPKPKPRPRRNCWDLIFGRSR